MVWLGVASSSPQARDESICRADGRTLTDESGTLSDDQTGDPIDCTQGGCNGADSSCFGGICAGGRNGYSDNLDCGKHIHAPAGNTIELTFTHLALETADACPPPGEPCTHTHPSTPFWLAARVHSPPQPGTRNL